MAQVWAALCPGSSPRPEQQPGSHFHQSFPLTCKHAPTSLLLISYESKVLPNGNLPKSAWEISSLPFFLFTNKPLRRSLHLLHLQSNFPFTLQHTEMWCLALSVFAIHQGPSNDRFHSSSFLCMPPWNPCPWFLECPGSPLTLPETAYESYWIGTFPPFPWRCYSTAEDPFRFYLINVPVNLTYNSILYIYIERDQDSIFHSRPKLSPAYKPFLVETCSGD